MSASTLSVAPTPEPQRIRWTRQQYHDMHEYGILLGHCELVEGEILSKQGQKRPHATTIILLTKWLFALFDGICVQCQGPIDVAEADNPTSEPEPDAVVLAQPITAYIERNPGPADVLLAVEVSDSTLDFDRKTKAALYARAGIAEYWVLDVNGRQIYVHRQPSPEGYGDIVTYPADAEIATRARPDVPVRIADLLPPINTNETHADDK